MILMGWFLESSLAQLTMYSSASLSRFRSRKGDGSRDWKSCPMSLTRSSITSAGVLTSLAPNSTPSHDGIMSRHTSERYYNSRLLIELQGNDQGCARRKILANDFSQVAE